MPWDRHPDRQQGRAGGQYQAGALAWSPRYSYYVDPKWCRYIQHEMSLDPEQALEEAIPADNACLEGVNREAAVAAIHLCRGNNRSQW